MARRVGYNVVVGAETGIIKGVDIEKQVWDNLTDLNSALKDNEVTSICWGIEGSQSQVYVGRRGQTVSQFDIFRQTLGATRSVQGGKGSVRGLSTHTDRLVTCTESGFLGVWKGDELQSSLEVGKDLFCMRNNPWDTRLVATGGQENEIKLWDLDTLGDPLFTAKNVKNDWLNLRVPVWVTDVGFMPNSHKLVTCTGHHQVRVYDPSTDRRRPVLDMTFDEYPLTCLSLRPDGNSVVVGNTLGNMAMLDLRMGAEVCRYKGFGGAIRSLQCHPSAPVVVSCGLDRHLHMHDINTQDELCKLYLKSRLNCLLLTDEWPRDDDDVVTSPPADDITTPPAGDDSSNESTDPLWQQMDVVETKKFKHKNRKALSESVVKRPAPDSNDDDESKPSAPTTSTKCLMSRRKTPLWSPVAMGSINQH